MYVIRVKLDFGNSYTVIHGNVDEVLDFLKEFLIEAERVGLSFKAFFEGFKE